MKTRNILGLNFMKVSRLKVAGTCCSDSSEDEELSDFVFGCFRCHWVVEENGRMKEMAWYALLVGS